MPLKYFPVTVERFLDFASPMTSLWSWWTLSCNLFVITTWLGGLVIMCVFRQCGVSHHLLSLGKAWHIFFFSAESSRIIHQELDGTLGAIPSSFPPTAGIFFYHKVIQRFLSCKSYKKWILRGNQACAHMCTHISEELSGNNTYHMQYIMIVQFYFNFFYCILLICIWNKIYDRKYVSAGWVTTKWISCLTNILQSSGFFIFTF